MNWTTKTILGLIFILALWGWGFFGLDWLVKTLTHHHAEHPPSDWQLVCIVVIYCIAGPGSVAVWVLWVRRKVGEEHAEDTRERIGALRVTPRPLKPDPDLAPGATARLEEVVSPTGLPTDQTVLALWNERSTEERLAILSDLQAIADKQAKAGTTSGMESLSKKPVVEVYAARPYLESLVVHFMYDLRFWCRSISGSDWDEHRIHLGEAVCRGGKVVSHEAVKEETSIPELECEAYDDAAVYRKRREEAVAEFRRDWLDMPFPHEAG